MDEAQIATGNRGIKSNKNERMHLNRYWLRMFENGKTKHTNCWTQKN